MASTSLARILERTACIMAAAPLVLASSAPASASELVTDPGQRTLRNNGSGDFSGILGYDLTVGPEDAQVTHLGVYDAPGNADTSDDGTVGDGLEESAVVGLYRTSDRQLLVEVTIPSGADAEVANGFRYVKLDEPVTVKAGETYRLAMGLSLGGNGFLNYGGGQSGPTTSDDFMIGKLSYHAVRSDGSVLVMPNSTRDGSPYMGPTLRYSGGAPVPSRAVPEAMEAPGDRLKDLADLPGEFVLAEDFEQVDGRLPDGWAFSSLAHRQTDEILFEAPGAGYTGRSMKFSRMPVSERRGEYGGLNFMLPKPADRVALEFDLRAAPGPDKHIAMEVFSFGPESPESNDPSQLCLRIRPRGMQQLAGIETGRVNIPNTRLDAAGSDANSPWHQVTPWHRVRLVMDRDSEGIDIYLSEANRPDLPDQPTATVPAYSLGQPIASLRFGAGSDHCWIDNVVIRTGSEIPAPGTPEVRAPRDGEFQLWTPDTFPRSFDQIDYPQGIEYHIMGTRRGLPWKWYHGTAIEHHNGKLYATWGANPKHENAPGEVTVVVESADGGKTWTTPEVLAPGDGKGGAEFSHSHGTLLSHQGKLWSFVQKWAGGWDNPLSTEAFVLHEQTGEWESQGVVATQGWPLDRPEKTADGNWVMGVSGFKMRKPGIMISHGDDLSQWDTIAIPTDRDGMFAETSVLADGNDVLSITRWAGNRALVSTSSDGGRTWAEAQRSNLPMVTSKPDSGVLSTGQWYAVINMESRNNLMIVVGKPGEKGFSKVYKVRYGAPPIEKYAYRGDAMPHAYAYPYALEHDGKLYVTYSVGKADCEVAIIPIASLSAD